ncbi:MAG: type II secretion system protein, partial [Planctomycetota bacterium]
MIRSAKTRAFTLIELVVSVVLIAMLGAATTSALSGSLRARQSSEAREQAFQRAVLAAEMIARDLQGLVRDPEPVNMLLRVIDADEAGTESDELLFAARTLREARPGEPGRLDAGEGGTYEIHYRLEEVIGSFGEEEDSERESFHLWQRMDPVLDDVPDGGGIARVVVEGVVEFEVEVFDGAEWVLSWDSDRDGMPYAVRVFVRATDDDGRTTR